MTYPLNDDKPLGESLGWQRIATSRLYQSHWHNLRQDQVVLPAGQEITFTYQEHPGFVTVVPVTDDGQVILLRSYRYAVDDWCWELPAGGLKPNHTPLQTAQEELREEIGGTAATWQEVGWFYSSNGISNEKAHIFLATGVTLGPTAHEPAEVMTLHRKPLAEALHMARTAQINDGPSALALILAEPYL